MAPGSPVSLRLPGQVVTGKSRDDMIESLAAAMASAIRQAVLERGVAHIALSGGSTPKPLFLQLCTDPLFGFLPWQQTHAWLVDERQVPLDHDKSNYRMIHELLLAHLPMPEEHRHPVPVDRHEPAEAYEAEFRRTLGVAEGVPALDFVLLGMGDDAHTASLFPLSPALGVDDRCFVENGGPTVVPPDRVTMTYPLINHAREVAVLVTGTAKHPTLREVAEAYESGEPSFHQLPVTGVRPHAGSLTWFLDPEAAMGA